MFDPATRFVSAQATDAPGRVGAAPEAGEPARSWLPSALASLGPVLCLYRLADTHVLSGYQNAAYVQARVRVDSDGPRELLSFYDLLRQPSWHLHLLPDSDFLAWEQVMARLPPTAEPDRRTVSDVSERAPVRRELRNPAWRACALRLHAVPGPALAISEVRLSAVGRRVAQQIAKASDAAPAVFIEAAPAVDGF